MTYRNDHDAALARIDALERELVEARRETERYKREAKGTRPPTRSSKLSAGADVDRELEAALRAAEAHRRQKEEREKYRYRDREYVDAENELMARIESGRRTTASSRATPVPSDATNGSLLLFAVVAVLFAMLVIAAQ